MNGLTKIKGELASAKRAGARVRPSRDEAEAAVVTLIQWAGEDPDREGLLKTPFRVEKAMRDVTAGYTQDPVKILNEAMFTVDTDEMVIVKDIELYSLCEHHMLPFFGTCHVGYLPRGRVVGLSKIQRLVGVFAHRLQLQEKMTKEIAEALSGALEPRGVGVVVEARHLCMEMRGVQKPGGQMITSCMLGTFRKDPRTRAEFLDLVRRS